MYNSAVCVWVQRVCGILFYAWLYCESLSVLKIKSLLEKGLKTQWCIFSKLSY